MKTYSVVGRLGAQSLGQHSYAETRAGLDEWVPNQEARGRILSRSTLELYRFESRAY